MKVLRILCMISMFFSTLSYGQNTSVYFDQETGTFNGLIHRINKSVIKIDGSGTIKEILLFNSVTDAGVYIRNPREVFKPFKKVNISGVDVYMENYFSAKYYTSNEYNSGKIKEINGIQINYFNPTQYNSGKLKSIGALEIRYYNPNQYNSGKVKSIEGLAFKYYTPTEYNSGKIKQIGDITVNYYNPNEYNSGKVKRIGGISVKYYTPTEYNSGKFKEMHGEDQTFFLR